MRTNKIILSISALAGLLAGLSHTPANASLVTVSGTNVDFIYDDSLLGLYGTPTISGDNLFFSPTQFRSSSLNGAGMSSTSATTYIDIHAHDGYSFGSLALTEIGDYKLLGQNSFVNIGGEMLVIDKNNPPASGPYTNAFLSTSDNLGLRDGAPALVDRVNAGRPDRRQLERHHYAAGDAREYARCLYHDGHVQPAIRGTPEP